MLAFDILRVRRSLVLRNLATYDPTLSQRQKVQLGRASYDHFFQTILEFLYSRLHRPDKDVELVGRQHLDAALAQGKGVYILCFHMGNWESMGSAITHKVRPCRVIVKKVGNDSVNSFVQEQRDRNGFGTIVKGQKGTATRHIFRTLKEGGIVGFAFDQARSNSPRLPFFSKQASTNVSLAAIWRKRPAPIIVSYAERTGFAQHKVHFLPELDLTTSEDKESDIIAHSTEFNRILEQIIRKQPEQYFWLHNRWKKHKSQPATTEKSQLAAQSALS